MTESAHRKKIIFLFFTIILFSIFVSRKTKGLALAKLKREKYTVSTQVENKPDRMDSIEEPVNTPNAMFFEVDEELNPVKEVYPDMVVSENEVLGSADGSCERGDFVYSSKKVCSREVDDISMNLEGGERDGDLISRNSKIELFSVEVPPLMSGSYPMHNSTKQIYIDEENKKDYWSLPPAGEMITSEVVAGNLYPGDERGKELIQYAEESRTRKFGLTYSLEVTGDADVQGDNGSGEFTVQEYHDNLCGGDCRNYPNPTPQKYLTNSNVLAHTMNPPGYYESLEEVEEEEIVNDCGEDTIFLDMEITGNKAVGCTPSVVDIVINFFKRLFTPKDEEACIPSEEGGTEGDCISTANLVIMMESPWGSKEDCTNVVDGKCVTEYNDLRNGQFDIPARGDSGKVYVLTDCDILVDGELEGVKCAWDINYIADELEFQSRDNVPGELYPDKMEYLEFHVRESEVRSDEVYKM